MSGLRKFLLISLEDMMHDKNCGGVGLHNLELRNKAYDGNLIWQMVNKPNNLWCQIMQSKYLDSLDPLRILTALNLPQGSKIWKFMTASRHVILDYVSWEINNGRQALFWEDSWNGLPPLATRQEFLVFIQIFKDNWGDRVVDYVSQVDPLSHKVNWKDPSNLPIPDHIALLFNQVVSDRDVFFLEQEDKIFWAPAINGFYSIKDGYLALRNLENNLIKKRAYFFYWNDCTLPKAGCFSWLALRNRPLTSDRLERFNIAQKFKCLLCGKFFENVDHVFLQCDFAQDCWLFLLGKLSISMPLPNSLWDLF